MSEELKPCPFCGSPGVVRESEFGDAYSYYATCEGETCFASVGENYDAYAIPDHCFNSAQGARDAWNRRADTEATRALVSIAHFLALLSPDEVPKMTAGALSRAIILSIQADRIRAQLPVDMKTATEMAISRARAEAHMEILRHQYGADSDKRLEIVTGALIQNGDSE